MQLIGFPFFESQAIWIAQLLSGKRTLPSYDDMMQSIKQFYHSKDIAGIPKHNTHDLAEFEVLVFLQQSRSIESTNHLTSNYILSKILQPDPISLCCSIVTDMVITSDFHIWRNGGKNCV